MAAFVWGKNGEKLTPEDVERQRLASAMMYKQGADFSPAGHWSEALGRAFNGWASGRINKIAGKGEKEGLAGADERIAAILAGQGGGGGGGYTASSSGAPGGAAPAVVAPKPAGPEYPIGVDALPQSPTTPGGLSMGTEVQTVDPTLELIKGFEGFRETPYWDVNALRTGYGSDTITTADGRVIPVTKDTRVSREDADRDLQRRAQTEFAPLAASAVGAETFAALDPNQKAALTSIAYNYGELPSSVAAAVRSGDPQAAAAAIAALGSHNGGINAGRRSKEAEVYLGASVPGGTATYDTAGGAPAVPGGTGGMDIASLLALQSDPWVAKKYGGVVDALMGQQFSRQNALWEQQQKMADPMYQAQLEMAQIELQRAQNPAAPKPIEVGGVLLDPNTYEPIFDSRTAGPADPFAGTQVIDGRLVAPDGQGGFKEVYTPPPAAPEAPTTKTVKLSDGSDVMVQWNPATQVWDAAPIPQGGTGGTGAPAKLTESQAKTTLFQTMQTETAPVLDQIEQIWDPTNMGDAIARSTPLAGNFFQSEEGQMYGAAASAWAEGALRISTGAAATEPEIQRITKTYFAQPGDTPNVVAFKKSMRDAYTRAINASLGQDVSGQGTLTLPENFAAQYQAENPPPAFVANPTITSTAEKNGVTVEEIWQNMSPEARKKFGG